MTEIKTGSCHCGAIEFQLQLKDGFENLRRCNCSICRRKGAIMAGVPLERLQITKGEHKLTLYQWNTKTAKHYFCSVCGIYTHHQRRSNPSEYGVNIGCFDDFNYFEIRDIPVGDGVNHPSDRIT